MLLVLLLSTAVTLRLRALLRLELTRVEFITRSAAKLPLSRSCVRLQMMQVILFNNFTVGIAAEESQYDGKAYAVCKLASAG